jgi:hypothetical protein
MVEAQGGRVAASEGRKRAVLAMRMTQATERDHWFVARTPLVG